MIRKIVYGISFTSERQEKLNYHLFWLKLFLFHQRSCNKISLHKLFNGSVRYNRSTFKPDFSNLKTFSEKFLEFKKLKEKMSQQEIKGEIEKLVRLLRCVLEDKYHLNPENTQIYLEKYHFEESVETKMHFSNYCLNNSVEKKKGRYFFGGNNPGFDSLFVLDATDELSGKDFLIFLARSVILSICFLSLNFSSLHQALLSAH